MGYYIQGDAARADQIKAAFEELGYDTGNLGFTSSQLYYTIEGKVELMCTKALQNLIKTHPDYKELKLPVKPKFKVGDDVKTGNTIDTVAEVGHTTRSYYCESGRVIYFANQDLWHLVPKPHYDIANFYAGMPVLVRDDKGEEWRYTAFSHMSLRFSPSKFAAGCTYWRQCIPFNDDTKHLLGTTDMCDEQYINW